jgi:tetratricopeptide (TPR) repeat protein
MILSVVLFHVVSRFRVPAVPFLILFSAYALGRVCEWWKQRKWNSLALFVVIFLALFYGLRTPANQTKNRYVDYCNWSYSYMLEEEWFDLDKAETYGMRCLDTERKLNAGWGITNTSLASIYKLFGSYLIQQGNQTTNQMLQYTFSINPFDPEIYRMYSDFKLGQGDAQSAIRYLQISRIANSNNKASLRSLIQLYYKEDSKLGRLLTALKIILPKEKNPVIVQQVKEEINKLEALIARENVHRDSYLNNARKYLANGKWSAAIGEYKKLNIYNVSSPEFFIEQGVAYESLGDQESALNSYYDALLIDGNNPQLNKNLGNYYLSINNLALVILHWKRYLEAAPKDSEYILIKKRYQFFSKQLRMKKLEKQIFSLSKDQTREIFKIYSNMNLKLG